jgi:UDP-N-acetylglucosamine---dolichyl-phosphate N-acetylglucosaminyltransferase
MVKQTTPKIYIVIPAFNEERVLASVIEEIRHEGYHNIIVVDDGSFDHTFTIAQEQNCIALQHMINRGKGAATQTGLDAAKLLDADITVTVDADGQHNPKDIQKLIEPIQNQQCDVALGSRLINTNESMPWGRKVINIIGNIITYLFYGIYVSDSQSGLRAYNKKAIQLINTTMDRYEFESEVLQQIHTFKLTFQEVPIKVRYTKYSLTRYNELTNFKPNNLMNGFRMLFKMIIRSITT